MTFSMQDATQVGLRIGLKRFNRRVALFAVAFVVTVLFFVGLARSAYAETDSASRTGKHVLTVYDNGAELGILTEADTLREALEAEGIEIGANDVTEPALDDELVASAYDVNIFRARPVSIHDGTTVTKVMTPYRSVSQIAKQADITLQKEDIATLETHGDVASAGAVERLVIDRAVEVSLLFYGERQKVFTRAATVGELLDEKDIEMTSSDRISPSVSTVLRDGMTIDLWREGKQTLTREEVAKFSVREVQDANREVGYRKVETPGQDGKKLVTYEIVVKNGQEVSKKAIKTVMIDEPKEQVEIVGAKVAGPEEIVAKIRSAATSKGIDAQRVLLIAQCESGFNPRADSGYYKGIFQHDPNYWAARAERYGFGGASYYDVDAQIGVSTSMMAEGGWTHWGCDPGPQ